MDEIIVNSKLGRIQRASKFAVEDVLPADWKAEGVESSVIDKVLDLINASLAR